MNKYKFVFDPLMELSSWEAFEEDFGSLPTGMTPSSSSPEECEVFSELGSAKTEAIIRKLHREHAFGEAKLISDNP